MINYLKMRENSDFFKDIDNEYKAYVFGFIASDGSICYKPEERRYFCKIEISKTDIDILEKIKKAMNCNGEIILRNDKRILPQGGSKIFDSCRLTFYNKLLVEDLIRLRITPRKSLTLNINLDNIREDLTPHFIRGLVDGDGSFGIYNGKTEKRKHYTFSLAGSNVLLSNLKLLLDKKLNLSMGLIKNGKISNLYTKNKKGFFLLFLIFYTKIVLFILIENTLII